MTEPELLTIPQVAQRLQVSGSSLRRWIREGQIPAVRMGNAIRLRREVVDALARDGVPTEASEQAAS